MRASGLWLVLLAACLGAQRGDGGGPPRHPLDGVAAVVNGQVITWSEVREAVGDVFATLGYATREEKLRRLEQFALARLARLVEGRLLLQTAEEVGIQVKDAEVERLVRAEEKAAGSRERFLAELARKKLSLAAFRRRQREELLRLRLLQSQVFATPWSKGLRRFHLEIRPCDLRRYYERHREAFRQPARVWLRQAIVAAEEAGGEARARALAERVAADLRRGVPPAEVDARYGLGSPTLAAPAERLKPLAGLEGLKDAVRRFALRALPGSVSDPIPLGAETWGVFVLVRREEARILPFEAVQGQVREALLEERLHRVDAAFRRWLLRRADVRPPELARWLRGEGPAPRIPPRVLRGILAGEGGVAPGRGST